ncbi:MAG: F0F1 ATP synthase subunit gamma [Verrucomicrobia bacterium]|nr:F0F1 ATP synthase subunit gamma [Verrucomicrobiota bacterium]
MCQACAFTATFGFRCGQVSAIGQTALEARDLLASLVEEFYFIALYRAFVESLAAENGMRLQSMEAAKQNIDDTKSQLRQRAQQLRQDAITAELLDIIAGAEAVEHE